MMKKTAMVIILTFLFATIIVVSLVLLDSKYNMRHYFDDWKSETEYDTVNIVNYYDVYDHNGEVLFRMDKFLPHNIISVLYCVKGERVYFSYQTKNPETGLWNIWHIASVSVSGENLKEYYSGNLFDDNIKGPTLCDLSRNTDKAEEYGGLYCDNQIYLHGNARTVAFDLETETIKEVDSLPVSRYIGKIEDKQTLTVKDTENGTEHTVTLESMANSNVYAKKLLALSDRRIWNGEATTYELFSYVKIVDDQIYIVCEILNWNGESFAVVFRYDFSTDKVYYESSNKVGGIVSNRYEVAPYY